MVSVMIEIEIRKVNLLVFLKEVDFDMKLHYKKHIQKLVFIVQMCGLDLGYNDYEWYLYGPYSKLLTRDLIELEELEKELIGGLKGVVIKDE